MWYDHQDIRAWLAVKRVNKLLEVARLEKNKLIQFCAELEAKSQEAFRIVAKNNFSTTMGPRQPSQLVRNPYESILKYKLLLNQINHSINKFIKLIFKFNNLR